MIAAVSLRLLYLIFRQMLGLVLLIGRRSATKDVELLVYVTRSPSCAAPTHDHAWTGPTGPCSPPSSGGCPDHCVAVAWSPRTRSCAGIAASSGEDGPTRSGPDGHRLTTSSLTWWCGWRGRTRAGATCGSKASCSSSATASGLDHPADPEAPPHPTGAAPAQRHQLAAIPAHPGQQHARRRLLPRRLRGDTATPLRPSHLRSATATCTSWA
jgi:hypothetical protein